jgi:hypothetical protein
VTIRPLAALAIAFSCLVVRHDARAESRPSREVSLIIAAEAPAGDELELVVRELLGRLSIAVEITRVDRIDVREIAWPRPSTRPWLARVWIDLRDAGSATLYLHDAAHDRLFVRRVARARGNDELAREELGHILETCTEGLLSGANVGLPRGDVAPILTPEHAELGVTHEVAPPTSWKFGVLYEVATLSSQVRITHGPALSVSFRAPIRGVHAGAWLTGQYRVPFDLAASPVAARFAATAFRALASVEVPTNATTTWRFGLGGGLDVLWITPESSDVRFRLEPPRTLAFGLARAAVGIDLRVARSASFTAMVAVDFDPSATTYVIAVREGEQVLLRPWVARPGMQVGVDFP